MKGRKVGRTRRKHLIQFAKEKLFRLKSKNYIIRSARTKRSIPTILYILVRI